MQTVQKPLRRRMRRWLLIVLVILLIILYGIYPLALALAATAPGGAAVGAPPEGLEDVTLTTTDGVDLAAWYAPSQNGAAIILLHGAGQSREMLRGPAAMLAAHGYGVLAFDQRGHGASDGPTNRFGW